MHRVENQCKENWTRAALGIMEHLQGESESLFPEDIRSRERTHLVFGAHFGVERDHKTIGN